MIETVAFLLGQIFINIFIRFFKSERLNYIFTNLSYLIFIILILLYPYWSYKISDLIYQPDPSLTFRCGNAQLGSVMFQYIIGGPAMLLTQYLLNKYFHKNCNVDKQVM